MIAGEPIDFLGIIVTGSAFVMLDHKNYKTIKIGDMIGHMFAADMTTRDTHLATITASMDGMIAVLPFGDIKLEVRKSPEALFKTMMIASKYAMETFSYNLNGCEHNPAIKHSATALMTKKLREFYFKNPAMRSFLNGADKRDEKFIIQAMKPCEVETAERVIRKGTWDRCILVVTDGELMSFNEGGENEIYEEGAILGVE